MKVLIIIPAYNEEGNILKTVSNLKKVKIKDITLDYIIINDGSTDNTKQICMDNNLNFLDLPFNLGIGGAVQSGYKWALKYNYDIAIQFDGDSQHRAEYFSHLIEEIKKGSDIAIGSRFIEPLSEFKSTFMRRVGIKWLSFLLKITTRKKIYDPTSGFRAVNKEVIYLFANDYPTDYPEPDTIAYLAKKGYKISEVPVEMNPRLEGKSSISAFNSIYYMIKVSIAVLLRTIMGGGRK